MMVQAAQHLRNHPGPLGVFFRRIARKKNYNVAVVATARKLTVIAWHMLSKNQPYRYAVPRVTDEKLSHLRILATGHRNKSGVPGGTRSTAKLPGGSRTIKPLADVYQKEELPPLAPAPVGEHRALRRAGCLRFTQSLGKEHVVPRNRTNNNPNSTRR
jgi:hypothetical protein